MALNRALDACPAVAKPQARLARCRGSNLSNAMPVLPQSRARAESAEKSSAAAGSGMPARAAPCATLASCCAPNNSVMDTDARTSRSSDSLLDAVQLDDSPRRAFPSLFQRLPWCNASICQPCKSWIASSASGVRESEMRRLSKGASMRAWRVGVDAAIAAAPASTVVASVHSPILYF
eukprot:scaffold2616_cov106-Isochrysis_galbana.AAC.6